MSDLTASLEAFVRRVMARVDYYVRYQAKVVAQNADGTLELMPDDAKIPGLSRVPIYSGIAGVTLLVPSGSRCLLEFAGGDPSKPIVTGWEPGEALKLTVTAGTLKVSGTESVASGFTGAFATMSGQVVTVVDGIVVNIAG